MKLKKSSRIILGVETSADDTGIALLKVSENKTGDIFSILANQIHSQAVLHSEFGGVFPNLAKREHSKNIVPLFMNSLKEAKLLKKRKKSQIASKKTVLLLAKLLVREGEIETNLIKFLTEYEKPDIDLITVTNGPGLEPALWVGINFARAISAIWDIPVIPVNHMEGHLLSSLFPTKKTKSFKLSFKNLPLPALALLVSGGHTEIVIAKDIGKYTVIGSTRDDAAGEAFDKIARMLELPYPGGPEISKLAEQARLDKKLQNKPSLPLPRPMIKSPDFDFSFSGLKTATLYMLRDMNKKPTGNEKKLIAREVEDSIVEVLTSKTLRAIKKYGAKTVVVGGGVSANKKLREVLTLAVKKLDIKIPVHFPSQTLSTDNALMIILAGYLKSKRIKKIPSAVIIAEGNLKL